MSEVVNISFVTDENYMRPVSVAIESIICNMKSKYKINFYILDVGIKKESIKSLKQMYRQNKDISFMFINVDKSNIEKYKRNPRMSSAVYAKIYLSDLIDVEGIIFLDGDLVVNDDIIKLWQEFDENVLIKAVWNPFYDYDNKYFDVDDDHQTFNSGVMLLNLNEMRKHKSGDKLKEFLDEFHGKTKLHDQAAFNAVFKNDWVQLDLKWNYQHRMIRNHHSDLNMSRERYFELYKNPGIVHFTGKTKPWYFRNVHPYKPLYTQYYNKMYGEIIYDDINFKAFLKKVKVFLRYKYSYFSNLLGFNFVKHK